MRARPSYLCSSCGCEAAMAATAVALRQNATNPIWAPPPAYMQCYTVCTRAHTHTRTHTVTHIHTHKHTQSHTYTHTQTHCNPCTHMVHGCRDHLPGRARAPAAVSAQQPHHLDSTSPCSTSHSRVQQQGFSYSMPADSSNCQADACTHAYQIAIPTGSVRA